MENQALHTDKVMGGNTNCWINWNKDKHDWALQCAEAALSVSPITISAQILKQFAN